MRTTGTFTSEATTVTSELSQKRTLALTIDVEFASDKEARQLWRSVTDLFETGAFQGPEVEQIEQILMTMRDALHATYSHVPGQGELVVDLPDR